MPTILVVDDELSMREFLKILLEKEGYRVSTASEASEAIDLIQRAISSYGGDPSIGRKLWPLLNEAGFRDILLSSKWGQPDSLDEWPDFYNGWAKVYRGKIGEIILEEGWADETHLIEMSNAFKNLGRNKKGYAAAPWGEAVARK